MAFLNNFKNQISQLKLAQAIRRFCKFNKGLVVVTWKLLKNGALWLCYTVDGVKCSTFIGVEQLAELLKESFNVTTVKYMEAVIKKFFSKSISLYKAEYGMGFVKVEIVSSKSTYILNASEKSGRWELSTFKTGRVIATGDDLKATLAKLA